MHDLGDPVTERFKGLEVVTEELDAQIAADAGHHFVDAHFYRLHEDRTHRGHPGQLHLHQFDEFGLRLGASPLIARIQGHEDVRQFEAHRVCCNLGCSGARPDMSNLIGELFE